MSEPAADGIAGRVVVVTGGAQGLGRAIVEALIPLRATVVVLDRNVEGAKEAAAAAGGRSRGIGCDVADTASVEAAASAVRAEYGGCDALVNNAGILPKRTLEDETAETWDQTMAVNLHGPVPVHAEVRRAHVRAGPRRDRQHRLDRRHRADRRRRRLLRQQGRASSR